jgi:tRNA nucleotidyltransferase/poly(A) polymerase
MNTNLSAIGNEIQSQLSKLLHSPIYLVGGAVRDELIGKSIQDYDFATALPAEDVETLLQIAGYKVYVIGKKFGTIGTNITVLDKKYFIEITTFRTEQYNPNSRKPEVEFTPSLEEDLARRDFTINALAKDNLGNIIDLFDGQKDIENRLVRSVGNPLERFNEDPLRILRAIRFASTLDFDIDSQTSIAITEMSERLLDISKERIVKELDLSLIHI